MKNIMAKKITFGDDLIKELKKIRIKYNRRSSYKI